MTIKCLKFKPYEKNTLRGFADIELSRVGLIIKDCTLHSKNGKEWIGLPARSYQDKDGKTQWQPLVEFAEGASAARKAFQQQALDAIHAVAAKEPAQ